MKFYQDLHTTLYCMDFRKNDLPDESVQCVVTSPPYWGLRKYSGEQELVWPKPLSDNPCEHRWIDRKYLMHSGRGDAQKSGKYSTQEPIPDMPMADNTCSLCGAWKGSYGLEPTPEMYVKHTIEILREIRRVLRKDGVVFWNIGDSYNGSGGAGGDYNKGGLKEGQPKYPGRNVSTLKPKDLCLIPFRVAISAQEDGWWVRSIIIWSKPNPMPESVTDRPTESHEYVLMLTKSARYYWDADAVREQQTGNAHSRGSENGNETYQAARGSYKNFKSPVVDLPAGRNLRSVWSFPTQPFPAAHFAVFPEKLPELCIKAATSEVGCCSKCGKPWERVLDKKPSAFNIHVRDAKAGRATPEEGYKATQEEIDNYQGNHPDPGYRETIGWQPTCKCWRYAPDLPIIDGVGFKEPYPKVPSLVLDPFAGAGTTLWVAKKLNRRAVGYEISEEYCRLAVERMRQQVMI